LGDETKQDKEIVNEFCSFFSLNPTSIFDSTCSISTQYTATDITNILRDPIVNHQATRDLALFIYNTNGLVANAIDYAVALPCLDKVVYGKKRMFGKNKLNKNKDLMISALDSIGDKQFIRDVMFRSATEGTSFYYFETKTRKIDRSKFLNDWDVTNITELCDLGINISMMSLPYSHCKIVGFKNGRYVVAFNLEYFVKFDGERLERKLMKFPSEISNAYKLWSESKTGNQWYVIDNTKTLAHKIKSSKSEPWGRPYAIGSILDILYSEDFQNTKANVLKEMNNKFVFQTFPEGKDKGSSSLGADAQRVQHEAVKSALNTKNNYGGTSFASVAAGTKLDKLDISSTDIFDSKNETNLQDKIAQSCGTITSLIGGSGSGTYSSQQNNLALLFSQVYSWVKEIQDELVYLINTNIIKDTKNKVEVFYLPTSLVNRKEFFTMMKDLYTSASGSLTFLVASSGVSPDSYFSVLDEEIENGIYDKYKPHQTSYTMSKEQQSENNGRPQSDSLNDNTTKSQALGGNKLPRATK